MMTPLIELLKEHPDLANKTLAEVREWLDVQQEESRVELEMHNRELAEHKAAMQALSPYMDGFPGRTVGEALAIMRKVEGTDSSKVKAVEMFVANHPWMRIGGGR